jgi:putative pyruvate formate lyase activating enzyme
MRHDARDVWESGAVEKAIPNYAAVVKKKIPPKYLIAKAITTNYINLKDQSLEELQEIHKVMSLKFRNKRNEIISDNMNSNQESNNEIVKGTKKTTYLDVKEEIINRILESCCFCERKCKINRKIDERGFCRIGKESKVSSAFAHMGEEAPLVPSGTIFFTGCTLNCVFCQNFDISNKWREPSSSYIDISGEQLTKITENLCFQGDVQQIININYVGGDPTPNIHTILNSLQKLELNIPLIWNSNLYNTQEILNIIIDIIDLWLPDFKFGNNQCGSKYLGIPNYFDILCRNLIKVYDHGNEEIIIRHLLMPNHIDCCTKNIFKIIHEQIPKVQVNIMEQYRPQFKVTQINYSEINRRLNNDEISQAFELARKLILNYNLCS